MLFLLPFFSVHFGRQGWRKEGRKEGLCFAFFQKDAFFLFRESLSLSVSASRFPASWIPFSFDGKRVTDSPRHFFRTFRTDWLTTDSTARETVYTFSASAVNNNNRLSSFRNKVRAQNRGPFMLGVFLLHHGPFYDTMPSIALPHSLSSFGGTSLEYILHLRRHLYIFPT